MKTLNSILLAGILSGVSVSGVLFSQNIHEKPISFDRVAAPTKQKYKFTHYGVKQGLGSNYVNALTTNGHGKRVYIGTDDGGVTIGTLSNNKWTFKSYTKGLISHDIQSIFATADGNTVIVGTPWGITVGINHGGNWTWNQSYDTDNGIPGYYINAITGTTDGKTIYLGTNKGIAIGILSANGKYKFKAIKRGLPSKSILSLWLNEKIKTLYIGTANGVSVGKISDSKISFTNYTHGLASPDIYSVVTSADGKYLIAGAHVTSSSFKNGGVSVGILTDGKYKFTNYIKNEPFSKMVNVVATNSDASTIYVGSSIPANGNTKYGFSIGTLKNNKYSFVSNNKGLSAPFVDSISPVNNGQTVFLGVYYGGMLIGHEQN